MVIALFCWQWYAKERLKSSTKKFLVDTGILSNNTKFLSQECLMTFCSLIKYNDKPPTIRLYANPWPFLFLPKLTIYRLMRGFHRTFATGVACWQGTLTPPDTWSRPNIIDGPLCEIEPRCQLFPVGWQKSLYKFCFIWKKEIYRLEEGHNWFPLEYRLSAWNPFSQKTRKCCLPKTQTSWWCHRVSYCFWNQSVPSQGMLLRDPKLDICICNNRLWNWRSSNYLVCF